MAERSRRARSRVDYAALEAGLAENQIEHEQADGSNRGDNVGSDVVVDVAALREAISAAQAEHDRLAANEEIRKLQEELATLQAANSRLRNDGVHSRDQRALGAPPPSRRSVPVNAGTVREDARVMG